jgi:hypothetical protein
MPTDGRRGASLVLALDDDWESLGRLFDLLYEFDVVCLRTWPQLLRAMDRLAADFVLLADTVLHRRMTARMMVAELYRERGAKVVVLSEFARPEEVTAWREWGAIDCLPHPTKPHARALSLRRRLLGVDSVPLPHLRKPR